MVPRAIGTPKSVSTVSSMPRLLSPWQPEKYTIAPASFGPMLWTRMSAGMGVCVTWPHEQVREWPWCSVTRAAMVGSSATGWMVGGGSCGCGWAGKGWSHFRTGGVCK
jgi:hypothetical protein